MRQNLRGLIEAAAMCRAYACYGEGRAKWQTWTQVHKSDVDHHRDEQNVINTGLSMRKVTEPRVSDAGVIP